MPGVPRPLTVGFPRMHKEPGERRDFLPPLVGMLAGLGAEVFVESGIGEGMSYSDTDYTSISPRVHATDEDTAYKQDIVIVLRAPEGKYDRLRRGAVLVSMLHFPTRPARVRMLHELGIEAISLDTIENDDGKRMVENLRSVAWNGVSSAFTALERRWPALAVPGRPPVRVTIMGAGQIGKHAVEFATKYGDEARNEAFMRQGLAGVEVVTTGRNLTRDPDYLRARLTVTDILVDATQRRDPSVPLIPNEWLALLPAHAVICDLVVDPYLLDATPRVVRGIEGIPQGSLDQWEFGPDDPAWDEQLPPGIPTAHRRTVVSCYSWPGVRPEPCMHVYGSQLSPLLEALVLAGGIDGLAGDGSYHERAMWRASLRAWLRGEGAGVVAESALTVDTSGEPVEAEQPPV
jgi:alanine dehydrogenase